jgi:hypothetical protein
MQEKHSQEELPGATKYENEAAYQRNPETNATEFKGEIPEAEQEWEEAEEAADKQ